MNSQRNNRAQLTDDSPFLNPHRNAAKKLSQRKNLHNFQANTPMLVEENNNNNAYQSSMYSLKLNPIVMKR